MQKILSLCVRLNKGSEFDVCFNFAGYNNQITLNMYKKDSIANAVQTGEDIIQDYNKIVVLSGKPYKGDLTLDQGIEFLEGLL